MASGRKYRGKARSETRNIFLFYGELGIWIPCFLCKGRFRARRRRWLVGGTKEGKRIARRETFFYFMVSFVFQFLVFLRGPIQV